MNVGKRVGTNRQEHATAISSSSRRWGSRSALRRPAAAMERPLLPAVPSPAEAARPRWPPDAAAAPSAVRKQSPYLALSAPSPSYCSTASTTLSEASVRHQFSEPVNIRLSMFATEFIAEFHEHVQVDGESPDLGFRDTGYLFLATDDGMDVLRENHEAQRSCGAEVALLSPGELADRFAVSYTHLTLPTNREV